MFMLQWDIKSNRHKSDQKYWSICSKSNSILWLTVLTYFSWCSRDSRLWWHHSPPGLTWSPGEFVSRMNWSVSADNEFSFSFIKKGHHYEKMHQPVENLQRFNIKCLLHCYGLQFILKYRFPWSETIVNMLHVGKNKHLECLSLSPIGWFWSSWTCPGSLKQEITSIWLYPTYPTRGEGGGREGWRMMGSQVNKKQSKQIMVFIFNYHFIVTKIVVGATATSKATYRQSESVSCPAASHDLSMFDLKSNLQSETGTELTASSRLVSVVNSVLCDFLFPALQLVRYMCFQSQWHFSWIWLDEVID